MAQAGPGGRGSVPEANVAGADERRRPSVSESGLKPGAVGLGRLGAKAPADQRFDMWLEKQLHAMYEIASEPSSS